MKLPLSLCLLTALALATAPLGAAAVEPATVAQAAKVLDLETFPLPAGAERIGAQRLAGIGYTTTEPAAKAFEYVDRLLTKQGWEQLPGGYSQDGFANGDYAKEGFVVHVSVAPGADANVIAVRVTQQGNLRPSDVPVPADAAKLYAFPAVAMYKSPRSVEETVAACRERLVAEGWSPYGEVIGSNYYRKNAIQADINIQSAPAQGGATVISVTTHLLSLELPAPEFADDLRYADGTTDLGFDCDETPERVATFYRGALEPLGWTATTDEPIKVDWSLATIFRNAEQEMITLTTHDFEGRTRAQLDHQNAEEVAQDDAAAAAEAGRLATYRFDERPTIDITLPAGLEGVPAEEWSVRVATKSYDPFAVAAAITASLESQGWRDAAAAGEGPAIRSHRLVKDDREVRLVAAKAPKREPWVAIAGVGVNLRAR